MPSSAGDMVFVRGGQFTMGTASFYPEEAPPNERVVGPFALDRTPVTNDDFAAFVAATGYLTIAERALESADYPEFGDDQRAPGSLVFVPTDHPVDLRDWRQWWRWVPGADWRHPRGPESEIVGLGAHPVVQVAYADAVAYAEWAEKRLPTEAEFEFVAQAGRPGARYAWGDERDPDGVFMANTWRGRFPYLNTSEDGWPTTSPVGSFPANPLGFYDLIGNVWEWTSDYYTSSHYAAASEQHAAGAQAADTPSCCSPSVADRAGSADQAGRVAARSAEAGSTVPRRVLKGGSHLCAPEYCLRYRPAARSPQAEDSATTHIGFRCARSAR